MQTQTLPMRCQGEGESGGEERSDLGFFCSGFAGLKKFLTGFPPGCLKRGTTRRLSGIYGFRGLGSGEATGVECIFSEVLSVIILK